MLGPTPNRVRTADSAATAAADTRRPKEIGATVRRRRRRSGRRGRAFSKRPLYCAPPAAETAVVTRRSLRQFPAVAFSENSRHHQKRDPRDPTVMDAKVTRYIYL